jgi:hypothetical protein
VGDGRISPARPVDVAELGLARLISRGPWLYLSERAGVLKLATLQSPDRRDYVGTPDGGPTTPEEARTAAPLPF